MSAPRSVASIVRAACWRLRAARGAEAALLALAAALCVYGAALVSRAAGPGVGSLALLCALCCGAAWWLEHPVELGAAARALDRRLGHGGALATAVDLELRPAAGTSASRAPARSLNSMEELVCQRVLARLRPAEALRALLPPPFLPVAAPVLAGLFLVLAADARREPPASAPDLAALAQGFDRALALGTQDAELAGAAAGPALARVRAARAALPLDPAAWLRAPELPARLQELERGLAELAPRLAPAGAPPERLAESRAWLDALRQGLAEADPAPGRAGARRAGPRRAQSPVRSRTRARRPTNRIRWTPPPPSPLPTRSPPPRPGCSRGTGGRAPTTGSWSAGSSCRAPRARASDERGRVLAARRVADRRARLDLDLRCLRPGGAARRAARADRDRDRARAIPAPGPGRLRGHRAGRARDHQRRPLAQRRRPRAPRDPVERAGGRGQRRGGRAGRAHPSRVLDLADVGRAELDPRAASLGGVSPRERTDRLSEDIRAFRDEHQLARVVVVYLASVEPWLDERPHWHDLERFERALDQEGVFPASSLYAYAALQAGAAFVNFTPNLGSSVPALRQLARERKLPHCGQDGKTGETLLKTALAPMFAARALKVLSWQGYNLLGNKDGEALADPLRAESKLRNKDAALREILDEENLHTHVGIDFVPSLHDWKTAWDFVHFEGFLGARMSLQLTWSGSDSALAAPLVLDLVRWADLALRRGEVGEMAHTACYFKAPLAGGTHDFHQQFARLLAYAERR
jgi:myo-inositol-1-phosphate synthase